MQVFTKTQLIKYAIQINFLHQYVEIIYEEEREIKKINVQIEDILIIHDDLAE